MGSKINILLIATRDTKDKEAQYIRDCLEESGVNVFQLDPSVRKVVGQSEISPIQIAAAAGYTIEQVRDLKHEGKCIDVMIEGSLKVALALHEEVGLSGVIGLGGSMGTSLATTIMRAFPYGIAKVMISTMASGMTKPYIEAKDIAMFNPVCDIAGLNSITRNVFRNAALSVAAMAKDDAPKMRDTKGLVTMTTLGTTDKTTVHIREALEDKGYEVMVFHTTGAGGAAMDQIIKERDVALVLDISLIEISEFLHGGIFNCGPERGKAGLEKAVPTILAPGNLDFLTSGPIEMAEQQFPGRRYHIHNSALTAVRAGAEEFKNDAVHLAGMVDKATGPVSVFIPLKGFSNHDSPDGYLEDNSLPPVFAAELKKHIRASVPVTEMALHINDVAFADAIIEQALNYLE